MAGRSYSTQPDESRSFKSARIPGVSVWHASPMSDEQPTQPETYRTVTVERTGDFTYAARNVRGGVLPMGSGDDDTFTPVELLLAALAGCGAIDLEHLEGKRSPYASFAARTEGHKVRDEHGNHLVDLRVTFDVTFPEGEGGDQAREFLPRALAMIQDRLCSVGRTVQVGDPVRFLAGEVEP